MNPKITDYQDNGKIVRVEFPDGGKFKLQHPGNRAKLELESRYFNPTQGIDRAVFLDYCFENCVIAEKGEPPTVDNVTPKILEVWQRLLRRFLDGDIEPPVSKNRERANQERDKKGTLQTS